MLRATHVSMRLVIAITLAWRQKRRSRHQNGQSPQSLKSHTQVRRKPSLLLVTSKRQITCSSITELMIAAEAKLRFLRCIGLGVQVCLQHHWVPTMHASLQARTMRRALDSQCSGDRCLLCRKRSLNIPRLMSVLSASLAGVFGTLCITLLFTFGVEDLAGAIECTKPEKNSRSPVSVRLFCLHKFGW